LILRTISELPISNGSVAFDLNGDSKVDSTDLTALKRYLLGVIDKFPVGTDIPSQTQKTRYQAEDAMLYKAFEETIHAGYDGRSYVNYDNEPGGYIEWNVNVSSSGTYKLIFRYANGSNNNRPMEIRVNSNLVAGSLDFYPTSAWTVWNDQSIVVTLNAGNNVIRATGIASDGGPNVDYLEVIPTNEPPAPTLHRRLQLDLHLLVRVRWRDWTEGLWR